MNNVPTELWNYANDGDLIFKRYHDKYVASEAPWFNDRLHAFLFATMDEVRLRHAADCAKAVLRPIDYEDADRFRQGVLKREVSGLISYQRQRDHAAHTLYNYLLGWYFYTHLASIRQAISTAFKNRKYQGDVMDFAGLWPFVSVMHDIGYLFEGSLTPLSLATENEQVSMGLRIMRDYFSHEFWLASGATSVADRNCLRDMADVTELSFPGESLRTLADCLRDLHDLEQLRLTILSERREKKIEPNEPDPIAKEKGLPGDAFDIWCSHYEHFGPPSMVNRIKRLEKAFEWIMNEGLGATGIRLLDHATCSGLLLLLISTFYFRVHFGIGNSKPDSEYRRRVRDKFLDRRSRYEALWWWSAVVWATAATALHNIQQLPTCWPEHVGPTIPLSIEEDPLAFLGILVDCLQEWDRYTVSRETVVAGQLPLQGADVIMDHSNGQVIVDYRDLSVSRDVKKGLDRSLLGWQSYIDLRPKEAP